MRGWWGESLKRLLPHSTSMRGLGLAATLLILTSALAGCVSPDTVDPASATNTPVLDLGAVEVPQGAEAVPLEEGVRLVFEDVELPLQEEITIPEGTTMVRATAEVPEGTSVLTYMRHAESRNGRCEYQLLRSWNQGVTGTASCTGLTALDPLPTTWESYIVGEAETADLVHIDLLTRPLDGPVAKLNLSELSMPQHDALETEVQKVESHDGEPLHVEVTRPDVEGPVPTILVSSPYTDGDRAAGERPYDELIRDWVPRGYAVVIADVRGFGESGGCVEVWGPNEQKDQAVLVEWIADQAWSDGHVGMVGVSYVGTTPVQAAVQAPEHLDAIASVAAVVSAYEDWHFGGVPNGENLLSPVAYQALVGTPAQVQPEDPLATAVNHGNGLCDPTLTARANDPRAVYDDFYEERDFKLGAGDIEAAVLYEHGFEDPNVKSAMVPGWFNEITSPKLGLFGHWSHQYAVRGDQDTLLLAWMDAHVKGRDLGFDAVADVHVQTDEAQYRTGDTWPPQDASDVTLYPAFGEGSIGTEASEASATVRMDPTGLGDDLLGDAGTVLGLEGTAVSDIHLAGEAGLELAVTLESSENAHVAAFLYERGDDQPGWKLLTWGMANLAHREGHTEYHPASPGERLSMRLPFLPTEATIQEGHDVRLVLRAAEPIDWAVVQPGEPGEVTFHGGEDGTRLVLPAVEGSAYTPVPLTVGP